jgi:hypothetical protein
MNTIIKSTIAVCGFLAVASAPLTVGAETSVFSGKGAFGEMFNSNGNLQIYVRAFEKTTQSKSKKSGSSGAYIQAMYFTFGQERGQECWVGDGSTDTVQFKATGTLPNKVTASGTISITWYDMCSIDDAFVVDTITFYEDLTAMSDQSYSNWGTTHQEFGNIKIDNHFDYSYTPASVNASFISSEAFGTFTLEGGKIGQSRSHDMEIMQ